MKAEGLFVCFVCLFVCLFVDGAGDGQQGLADGVKKVTHLENREHLKCCID